jgi:hypothetical protein
MCQPRNSQGPHGIVNPELNRRRLALARSAVKTPRMSAAAKANASTDEGVLESEEGSEEVIQRLG